MTALGYWGGQKLEKEQDFVPDVTADIELSMNKFFLNDLEDDDVTEKSDQIVLPPLNQKILQAISLHKHANNIIELIKLNEATKSTEKIDLKIPPFKEVDTPVLLNFSSDDFINFRKGIEVEMCDMSKTIVRKILTKCVATLFAHIGYETSQESALDILTDVLQEFVKKISHNVKVAMEDEETRGYSGFSHVIERVLTEMGLGGISALDDYYQVHVIKYIDVLEQRCQDLTQWYQASTIPKSPSPIDKINKVVRVKVEEEDVTEIENPEVHFSTIDGDVNFSILETGYQLLNSLEAEANLQSMGDSVEDMTSTESPGVASVTSDDISHLSPFSKKKRFK